MLSPYPQGVGGYVSESEFLASPPTPQGDSVGAAGSMGTMALDSLCLSCLTRESAEVYLRYNFFVGFREQEMNGNYFTTKKCHHEFLDLRVVLQVTSVPAYGFARQT